MVAEGAVDQAHDLLLRAVAEQCQHAVGAPDEGGDDQIAMLSYGGQDGSLEEAIAGLLVQVESDDEGAGEDFCEPRRPAARCRWC